MNYYSPNIGYPDRTAFRLYLHFMILLGTVIMAGSYNGGYITFSTILSTTTRTIILKDTGFEGKYNVISRKNEW